MTTGAAKPTRPATSLLAVVFVLDDLRGQRASSACHRHRRHPVETGRPRWWITSPCYTSGKIPRFAPEGNPNREQLSLVTRVRDVQKERFELKRTLEYPFQLDFDVSVGVSSAVGACVMTYR